MPRTALTPVQLTRDLAITWGPSTAANVSGFTVIGGPIGLTLFITNADSSPHTAILRSSCYTGTPSGAANSAMLSASNVVFTQGTVGDMSVAVAAGDTQVLKVTASDRFTQLDGTVYLDFPVTPLSVTIRAFRDPYVIA